MEYWIVYDLASGAELWRGSGSAGTAAYQPLPEGAAMVLVPQAVVATPILDLDVLRAVLWARIDSEAEVVRQRFLTPGAGQAMTYQRKEAEARAWTADNSAAAPMLHAEAPARGMTVEALAAEVIGLADQWVAVGAAIEALRMGGKKAVTDAQTLGDIVAASVIDWQAIAS